MMNMFHSCRHLSFRHIELQKVIWEHHSIWKKATGIWNGLGRSKWIKYVKSIQILLSSRILFNSCNSFLAVFRRLLEIYLLNWVVFFIYFLLLFFFCSSVVVGLDRRRPYHHVLYIVMLLQSQEKYMVLKPVVLKLYSPWNYFQE